MQWLLVRLLSLRSRCFVKPSAVNFLLLRRKNMFKKTLSMLVIGAFPVLALAANGHHHDAHDHHTWAPSFYGQAGELDQVSRTIEIDMDDSMRFTPSEINVKA